MSVLDDLRAMSDEGYQAFQSKLMPTVSKERILGVRTPRLRAYAKTMDEENKASFLRALPHVFYEENNLHGFLINEIKEFDHCIAALDVFLPYVDNWATCDSLRPKVLKKHKKALLPHIRRWITSRHPYTVRFAIELLMLHYLDDEYREEYPQMVAEAYSDEYYVNMMIAWYFATALSVRYDAVVGYLKDRKLSPFVHAKTIQKAVESFRITETQKNELRTLR